MLPHVVSNLVNPVSGTEGPKIGDKLQEIGNPVNGAVPSKIENGISPHLLEHLNKTYSATDIDQKSLSSSTVADAELGAQESQGLKNSGMGYDSSAVDKSSKSLGRTIIGLMTLGMSELFLMLKGAINSKDSAALTTIMDSEAESLHGGTNGASNTAASSRNSIESSGLESSFSRQISSGIGAWLVGSNDVSTRVVTEERKRRIQRDSKRNDKDTPSENLQEADVSSSLVYASGTEDFINDKESERDSSSLQHSHGYHANEEDTSPSFQEDEEQKHGINKERTIIPIQVPIDTRKYPLSAEYVPVKTKNTPKVQKIVSDMDLRDATKKRKEQDASGEEENKEHLNEYKPHNDKRLKL